MNLFARDQTQAVYTPAAPQGAVTVTAPAAGVPITNVAPAWTFATYLGATADGVICAGISGVCSATPQPTTTWTATATGTTATFPNPFSRVDFYALDAAGVDLRLIGSVVGGAATLVDDGATRVWTYSLGVTGAVVYAALEGVSPAAIASTIYALGVNAAGNVAMVSAGVAQSIEAGT